MLEWDEARYERIFNALVRILCSLGWYRIDELPDIIQEAIARVLEAYPEIADEAPFIRVAARIAQHELIGKNRHKAVATKHLKKIGRSLANQHGADPADEYQRPEEVALFWELFRSLPDDERQVLQLAADGLTLEEIGQTMWPELPKTTTTQRAFRLLRLAKKHMAQKVRDANLDVQLLLSQPLFYWCMRQEESDPQEVPSLA